MLEASLCPMDCCTSFAPSDGNIEATRQECSSTSQALLEFRNFLCPFVSFGSIAALRLTEVRIPNHTVRGSAARLECHYEMDGEALYSVKWYKDGNEFYRYVPRDMPPVLIFQLPGVSVDLHNSTDTLVVLQSVNLSASGRYRCEVSAEAPSFQTVSDHGDMIVVGYSYTEWLVLRDAPRKYETLLSDGLIYGGWMKVLCAVQIPSSICAAGLMVEKGGEAKKSSLPPSP
ncbi:Immunoglobulin-like domain [Sergentomyia squamirostris]